MNVVHINGVSLLPGIDYVVGKNTISFSVPPPLGAEIVYTEVVDSKTGATYMTHLEGNGSTYLFHLDTDFIDRMELHELFDQVVKYRGNPAVRDALSKLQIVLELVKEDATIY